LGKYFKILIKYILCNKNTRGSDEKIDIEFPLVKLFSSLKYEKCENTYKLTLKFIKIVCGFVAYFIIYHKKNYCLYSLT
jgi:hypothetical protein